MKNLTIMSEKNYLNNMKPILIKACLFAAIIAGLSACSKNKPDEEQEPPFAVTDTLLRRMQFEKVTVQPVKSELKLSGKIIPDENNVVKVYPTLGGFVQDVKVQLGDYVEKGQTLAMIKSGDVAEYEKQLIDAQSDLLIAEKNLNVAQDMYASKLYSEKELVIAKKELEKSKAELNRMKEVYSVYNIDKNSDYVIKAPISGFVIERKIAQNMQIRSDLTDNIFTISQLNEVYVLANVYETDIAKVKEGYEANVTTIAYPDKVFTGRVQNIYKIIDPNTKTMLARIKLDKDNAQYQLKPDMFCAITLHYAEDEVMESIPAGAVIFDKSKNFVMVFKDKDHIDTREVEVYKTVDSTAYIKSGLKPGETVITKYQLYIYDALND